MTKSIRAMKEQISLIDLLIEVVDSRIPSSSRNPDIDELGKGKFRIIVLGKPDLADKSVTALWRAQFENAGIGVLEADCRKASDVSRIKALVTSVCAEKIERDKKRGIVGRPIRAMVCGIPNVGKSTFINSLCGRGAAKTGNKPGVTRSNQWIKTKAGIELLDTPGILWPKIDSEEASRNLAFIGSMNDEVLDSYGMSGELIEVLRTLYPGLIAGRYDIDESGEVTSVIEKIAASRGCITAGGEYNTDKASGILLSDFREGKLGRISLERPL